MSIFSIIGQFFNGIITKGTSLFGKKVLLLVSNQKPNATIIYAAAAPQYIKAAAEDLQWHIKLSTGVTLPLLTDAETQNLPENHVKLAVGESSFTKRIISKSALRFEEFVLKTDLNLQMIIMVGNDGPENPATHWAVCELLERTIGAKWLWPGNLGTFVIQKTTIICPEISYQWKPSFDFRMFRKNATQEVKKWMIHHRIASTRDFQETSNNQGWYEKYYQQYPEIFARTPDGRPYTNKWATKYPKFRLDNPKFFELMMEDYYSKNKPAIYTLFPTDGGLFDSEMLPGQDPKKVFYGEVPLTKPYLEFFTKFDQQVNGSRTVTRFDILAYSAYYFYPDDFLFNGKNFNVWFVDRNNDTVNWTKWAGSGAKMYLKPNWWNRASFGPDISFQKRGEMLDFCKKNGLAGIKMGGFKDNWSLQGINYYILARQLYSTKTIDELAAEYLEAFGEASAEVSKYFARCMANSDGFNQDFLDSIEEQLELEEDTNLTRVEAIPGMFPDILRTELRTLLDSALQKTTGTEKQRIEWLRSGLTVTDLVCNYVVTALKNPDNIPDSDILSFKVKEIESKYPYSITSKSFDAVMNSKFRIGDKDTTKD